jgi:hypothetical protein
LNTYRRQARQDTKSHAHEHLSFQQHASGLSADD